MHNIILRWDKSRDLAKKLKTKKNVVQMEILAVAQRQRIVEPNLAAIIYQWQHARRFLRGLTDGQVEPPIPRTPLFERLTKEMERTLGRRNWSQGYTFTDDHMIRDFPDRKEHIPLCYIPTVLPIPSCNGSLSVKEYEDIVTRLKAEELDLRNQIEVAELPYVDSPPKLLTMELPRRDSWGYRWSQKIH